MQSSSAIVLYSAVAAAAVLLVPHCHGRLHRSHAHTPTIHRPPPCLPGVPVCLSASVSVCMSVRPCPVTSMSCWWLRLARDIRLYTTQDSHCHWQQVVGYTVVSCIELNAAPFTTSGKRPRSLKKRGRCASVECSTRLSSAILSLSSNDYADDTCNLLQHHLPPRVFFWFQFLSFTRSLSFFLLSSLFFFFLLFNSLSLFYLFSFIFLILHSRLNLPFQFFYLALRTNNTTVDNVTRIVLIAFHSFLNFSSFLLLLILVRFRVLN